MCQLIYLCVFSGPLISKSPQESLSRIGEQSPNEEVEVDEQKFLLKASAGGNILERAFVPDAKENYSPKVQSIADQLATGLLSAGKHLQVGFLLFVPFNVLPIVPIGLSALCVSQLMPLLQSAPCSYTFVFKTVSHVKSVARV